MPRMRLSYVRLPKLVGTRSAASTADDISVHSLVHALTLTTHRRTYVLHAEVNAAMQGPGDELHIFTIYTEFDLISSHLYCMTND